MWIIAHKEDGIIYALGDTRNNAWENAALVRIADNREWRLESEIQLMRASGWAAQKCTIDLQDGRKYA